MKRVVTLALCFLCLHAAALRAAAAVDGSGLTPVEHQREVALRNRLCASKKLTCSYVDSIFTDPRWGEAAAHLPDYLGNHVRVSVTALALGLAISLPLAIAARNHPLSRGMLLGLDTSIDPMTGFRAILPVFAAVVVGGLGSIPGAVVGALVVGIGEELSLVLLAPVYKSAVGFAAILLVLTFRPSGLLGARQT